MGSEMCIRDRYKILVNHTGTSPDQHHSLVREVVGEFTQRFENDELDQVLLAYNHFVSVISQVPVIEQLLPIKPIEAESVDEREVLFEPSPEEILQTLLKKRPLKRPPSRLTTQPTQGWQWRIWVKSGPGNIAKKTYFSDMGPKWASKQQQPNKEKRITIRRRCLCLGDMLGSVVNEFIPPW